MSAAQGFHRSSVGLAQIARLKDPPDLPAARAGLLEAAQQRADPSILHALGELNTIIQTRSLWQPLIVPSFLICR